VHIEHQSLIELHRKKKLGMKIELTSISI